MSSLRKAYETLKKEHERLKLETNRSLSGTISAWERKLFEANKGNRETLDENKLLKDEVRTLREKLLASREDGALLFAERAELLDTIGNLTRIIGRFYRGQSLKVQT